MGVILTKYPNWGPILQALRNGKTFSPSSGGEVGDITFDHQPVEDDPSQLNYEMGVEPKIGVVYPPKSSIKE